MTRFILCLSLAAGAAGFVAQSPVFSTTTSTLPIQGPLSVTPSFSTQLASSTADAEDTVIEYEKLSLPARDGRPLKVFRTRTRLDLEHGSRR